MNILELQDNLKDVSDDVLMKEMQMPSGNAPQFLILSELKRRKRMRDEFQRRKAADISTVAEETITAAGMPQQGIMQAARAMAPESSIAQNTGIDTAMSTQPTQAPQQLQMAADGGILKLANGGRAGVGFRSGTTTSAIANLKVNFPELYEQYKDEPEILEQLALSKLDPAVEPYGSFAEDIGTFDFTDKAAPFKPTASMFKMDDSGGYYGDIDRSIDSIKKVFQLETEPQSRFGKFIRPYLRPDRDPEAFMYPPAQPGQYKYQGNMFTLNPDGTMVSEAGIPVDDAGKAAILAANLPKVPIPNYGEKDELPPGAIEQDFASLIADDSDGTPVEPLDLYNLPQSIIDARKMSTPSSLDFIASDGVPSSRVGGFSGDMTSSSIVPTRVDVPIEGTERPPAFDRYPEPAIPELPDLSGVEEQQAQDAVKAYLAGEDFPEGNVSDVVAMLNKAREFQESDTYTPPEEIYSGDPREIAKYQGASDEEIQAISDRLAVEADEAEAKKIADTAARKAVEEDLAAEDAAAFLALNQPPETPTFMEQVSEIIAAGQENADERRAEKEELKRLIEQADIERGGYESAAKKAQELERQEELKRLAEEATGTRTGTGKASGAATDLDAEIARQLQKLDKERDANKWLALAEAGMKMMSSTNPTLLGAVGEAGLAGTKALKTSQSEDSKTRLGLLALQQRADAAKTKGGMTTYQRQMLGKGYIAEGNKIIERGQLAQNPEQVAEGKDLVAYGRLLAGLPSLGSSGMTRTTVPVA
tara:strand:+ start:3624 stop:5909 length:2286 start_codon:yes stop_codon:yes gene_type:complete